MTNTYKNIIIKFHEVIDKSAVIPVKDVLYKTEKGYLDKENYINKGLDKKDWTYIPRDQEIGFLLEEIAEDETFRGSTNTKIY